MSPPGREPLEIPDTQVETVIIGDYRVPLVDLDREEFVGSKLVVHQTEYTYVRTYPVKGHSAVMPEAIAELLEQGKKVIVAERNERYYVYTA
jgi:hypothetical protein